MLCQAIVAAIGHQKAPDLTESQALVLVSARWPRYRLGPASPCLFGGTRRRTRYAPPAASNRPVVTGIPNGGSGAQPAPTRHDGARPRWRSGAALEKNQVVALESCMFSW